MTENKQNGFLGTARRTGHNGIERLNVQVSVKFISSTGTQKINVLAIVERQERTGTEGRNLQ